MAGKGQIIASGLITLALAIVLGYATGNFVFKLSRTSGIPDYKLAVLNSVQDAETIKLLLQQERNYAIDRVIFYVASRGGFGRSWEDITTLEPGKNGYSDTMGDGKDITLACSKKSIEAKEIPEKDVPYYSIRYNKDSAFYGKEYFTNSGNNVICVDYPSFDFVKQNFIEFATNYYHTPQSVIDYLSNRGMFIQLSYDLFVKGLDENANNFIADWKLSTEEQGISFDYGSVIIEDKPMPLLTYTFGFIASGDINTPFPSLYRAVKNFVSGTSTSFAYTDFVKSTTNSMRQVGDALLLARNCQGDICEWTKSGDSIYIEDEESPNSDVAVGKADFPETDEYALRALYCSVLSDQVNCDPETCKIEGSPNGCYASCINQKYFDEPGCQTPKDVCDKECPKEENIPQNRRLVCACDSFIPCPEDKECTLGERECEHVAWYPQSLGRARDGIMLESTNELLVGDGDERTLLKWELLDSSHSCDVSEPFRGDACCTLRYEPPAEGACTLDNWKTHMKQARNRDISWNFETIPENMQTTCVIIDGRCNSYHEAGKITSDDPFQCFRQTVESKTLEVINEEQNTNLDYKGFKMRFVDSEKSELKLEVSQDPVYEVRKTSCQSCTSGSLESQKTFTPSEFESVIEAYCVSASDPCGCYSGTKLKPPTASSLQDDNMKKEFLQNCMLSFAWSIDETLARKMSVDSKWLNIYDNVLTSANNDITLSPESASCSENKDCDINSGKRGQYSICSNNACDECTVGECRWDEIEIKGKISVCTSIIFGFCIAREDIETDRPIEQRPESCDKNTEKAFDINGIHYFCDTRKNGWDTVVAEEGTSCTKSVHCDLLPNYNGLQSACSDERRCVSCSQQYHLGRKIVTPEGEVLYCVNYNGVKQWISEGEDGDPCISNDRYCDPDSLGDGVLRGYCDTSGESPVCKMCDEGDLWFAQLYDGTYRCANGAVTESTCGNGICEGSEGENCETCQADCGCSSGNTCYSGVCSATHYCGDGICHSSENENCGTCEYDCACPGTYRCAQGECVLGGLH